MIEGRGFIRSIDGQGVACLAIWRYILKLPDSGSKRWSGGGHMSSWTYAGSYVLSFCGAIQHSTTVIGNDQSTSPMCA